jgi:hypothetical protein
MGLKDKVISIAQENVCVLEKWDDALIGAVHGLCDQCDWCARKNHQDETMDHPSHTLPRFRMASHTVAGGTRSVSPTSPSFDRVMRFTVI